MLGKPAASHESAGYTRTSDPLLARPRPEEQEYPALGVLVVIGAMVALYLSSFAGYLLFHFLAELYSIVIAAAILLLAWNTAGYMANDCLKVMGIGLAASASLDLLHTLAAPEMRLFSGVAEQLTTQFWLGARYLQVATLVAAPFFFRRRIDTRLLVLLGGAAGTALTIAVFFGYFPDCFDEARRLTRFKMGSEYGIVGLCAFSLLAFFRARQHLETGVFRLIVAAIFCTMAAELASAAGSTMAAALPMIGHFLKIAAFYLIYRALLVTGVKAPFALIFRDMKQTQEILIQQREFNRCLLDSMADGVVACDADGKLTLFNRAAREWHGLDPLRLPPEEWALHYDLFRSDGVTPLPTEEIPLAMAFRGEAVSDTGMAIVATGQPPRFILANGSEIADGQGHKLGAVVVMRDITAFRTLEQELREINQELERRVEVRTAALVASEEKYRALIQKIQAAVVVYGADGRILTSNVQAQRLLGLTGEKQAGDEAPTSRCLFLREDGTTLPEEEHPVNRLLAAGEPLRDMVVGVSRPRPEEVVWVLVSADPERDYQGDVVQVIVTFVDITRRKQAEVALQRLNRELRAISSCNQILMKAEDELSLLNNICRIICDEAGYRLTWVGYAEHDREKTIRPVAWAGMDSDYVATARTSWSEEVERGQGPAGRAIRSGEPVHIQDFVSEPCMGPWREAALARGYRSGIALPLKDENGKVFGAILIYSAEPYAVTAEEFKLLEELAGDLAFGITVLRTRAERKRAEESLRQSEVRLTEAQRLAHLGNWELDLVTNTLLWSEEIYRIFEIDPQEFGASYGAFLEAIHPDDREMVHHAYTQAVANRLPYGIIHRLLMADGRLKYVEERGETFYAADGRPLRSVGTVHDISERKLAEEAVLALNQELERRVAERTTELEAKNEELERMNQLFVGRELRMVELKEKIAELEGQATTAGRSGAEE